MFPDVAMEVLATRTSNHNPLRIRFLPNSQTHRRPRLFRFEARWNLDEECAKVINSTWGRGVGGDQQQETIQLKLENCQKALAEWSSSKFGDTGMKIKSLTKRLEKMQSQEHPWNMASIK